MDALLVLIGSGTKVNVANSLTGSTALHEAAAFGNKEIVEHLLKNVHADANASDFKALTPLMHASGAGYSIICLLLLQYSARIDICSAEGMTALHFAATNGDSYVTQQIVEAGKSLHDHEFKHSLRISSQGGFFLSGAHVGKGLRGEWKKLRVSERKEPSC